VGRAGGQAEDEGDQIPKDGAEQAGEQNFLVHHLDVDHAFADGLGDGGAEDEGGDEIPEGGPSDGAERREHARGDHRGDGIGGVVPAIRKLEDQSQADDRDEESERVHGRKSRTGVK
jgi:hypothetical protein